MLIDPESPDLLPMERAMLRPIAERLEATHALRCRHGAGNAPLDTAAAELHHGEPGPE